MPEWVKAVGPILTTGFCLGTLGAAIYLFVEAVRFRTGAVRMVGEVVRIHSEWKDVTRTDDSGSQSERVRVHFPVIAFEDSDEVRHEVQANCGSICAPSYQVGERVPILFAQGKPQSIRIDSFMSLYWNAACLLFMAIVGSMFLAFFLCYM